MNYIYVLATFMIKEGEIEEMAPRFWYKDPEDMEAYLALAGKPVPGKGGHTRYDDPFELRWPYAVVEKVPEGPMSINEVVGWWQCKWDESGTIVSVDRLSKAPFDTTGLVNFTG